MCVTGCLCPLSINPTRCLGTRNIQLQSLAAGQNKRLWFALDLTKIRLPPSVKGGKAGTTHACFVVLDVLEGSQSAGSSTVAASASASAGGTSVAASEFEEVGRTEVQQIYIAGMPWVAAW